MTEDKVEKKNKISQNKVGCEMITWYTTSMLLQFQRITPMSKYHKQHLRCNKPSSYNDKSSTL